MIKEDLLEIIVCPSCKSRLKYSKDKRHLICVKCKNKYPIKNNIPILLPNS